MSSGTRAPSPAGGGDYLKYDLCSGEGIYRTAAQVRLAYQQMGQALRATGRPIVYSLCQYGRDRVGTWGRAVGGHLWRTTGDIEDHYAAMAAIGFDRNGDPATTGPGGWNDPDMLEIGNGGMSEDEYRTHMTPFADATRSCRCPIMSSPIASRAISRRPRGPTSAP